MSLADPPSYSEATKKTHCEQAPSGELPNATTAAYPSQYGARSPLVDGTAYQPVVTNQPYNVVLVQPQDEQVHVSSNESVCQLIWAICNCLFCFWPIGLVAIIFASIAMDASRHGDGNRARHYTKVALWLNVSSLVLGIVLMGVFIGLVFANSD